MSSRASKKDSAHRSDFAVIGLVIFVIAVFGGQLALGLFRHAASKGWEKTPAVVIGIVDASKGAKLKYRYSYKGETFTGDRFRFLSTDTIPEKDEIHSRFKVGDSLSILVNPRAPKQSVVETPPVRWEHLSSRVVLIGIILVFGFFHFHRGSARWLRWSRSSH